MRLSSRSRPGPWASSDLTRRRALGGLVATGLKLAFPPGATADPHGSPEPRFPAAWILIMDRPRPWSDPAGRRAHQSLEASAGARLEVHERTWVEGEATAWLRVASSAGEVWLPEVWLAPPPVIVSAEELERIGEEPVDRFRGIDPDYVPPDLVPVSHGYEDGVEYWLRRAPAEAYEALIRAAWAEGVRLWVASAYRSYARQRTLYLNKLEASGWGQTTVAKPGHSEHQLGTAVDLTDGRAETLLREVFGESVAGRWLLRRGPDFGFAVSYTAANAPRTGYAPEPWHYRFFGTSAARRRHQAALTP